MDKKTLIKSVCSTYCQYYKPSKDEELACKGFLIIERLIQEGKDISFRKSARIPCAATKEMLIRILCSTCPFHDDECDFIVNKEALQPCGGFVALGHLLEEDLITVDDITNIR
jgi:hypothetical protein